MPRFLCFNSHCLFSLLLQVQATKAEVISTGKLPRAAHTILVDGNNVRGGGGRRLSRSDLLQSLHCLAATTNAAASATDTAAADAPAAAAEANASASAAATAEAGAGAVASRVVRMVLYFDGGIDAGESSDVAGRQSNGSGGGLETGANRGDNGQGSGSLAPCSLISGALQVVHCHRELADDIIVRDIAGMLLSERRADAATDGNCSPVTTATATNGVTDSAKEVKPSQTPPGQPKNGAGSATPCLTPVAAASILVVTSDRGLMLRCLELGVLVLKCGPFLRLMQSAQARRS